MKRREFIKLLGGAATWPIAGHAQQQIGRIAHVGVLSSSLDNPISSQGYGVLLAELRKLGFIEGRNLLVEHRRIDEGATKAFTAAVRVAVLNNPDNPAAARTYRDLEGAARAMGLQIQLHQATGIREIDAAFATLARERPDAIYVAGGSLFVTRRVHLANSSIRHGFPATFSTREYSEAGGLMSYGSNLADAYRQVGVYAGRILKGEKPADLPVVQASKFELVINAQTARLLGLTIPSGLLAIADEVIE